MVKIFDATQQLEGLGPLGEREAERYLLRKGMIILFRSYQDRVGEVTKTAIGFLKWHRLTDCAARFDVVAIRWPDTSAPPQIKHYKNAFEPVGEFQFFS